MTQSYSRSTQLNHGQLNRGQLNHNQLNRVCNDTDQAFSDVIAAISEGKYSWACVLMLRSAGYNPLHYMPYRTYNRIIKANLNLGKSRTTSSHSKTRSKGSPKGMAPNGSTHHGSPNNVTNSCSTHSSLNRSVNSLKPSDIDDLPHLESVQDGDKDTVIGGHSHASCSSSEDASIRRTSDHAWWNTLIHRINR